MSDPNPIYYRDLVRPDNSITDLISQLQALIAEYEGARAKIQSTASDMAKSMQMVSGATEDQREQITMTAKAADELAEEMKRTRDAEIAATTSLKQATEANKEYNQLAKLQAQLNRSAEGSYNQLSAQYRILKIRLNEMSEAERRNTEAGKAMERQAAAIYAKMNDLQTSTGKYTLQVGNYERALGGALGVNSKFIEALTDTEKAGETLKGMFNALLSPIGLVIAAVAAVTGAVKLFADSIHSTQVTGDAFDNAMAGWTSSWDYFKRAVSEVNFTNFINGLREAARAGRELQSVMDELSERRGSLALQRAMMADENSILLERLRNQKLSNAERIKAGQDYLNAVRPIYEREQKAAKDLMDAELNDLFEQSNKRRKLTEEEKKIGKEQLATYIQNYDLNLEQVRKARALNEALADPGNADAATLFIAQHADEATRALMEVTAQYDRLDNKRIEAYRKSAEDYYNLQAAYRNENRRIITQINSLENQQTKTVTTNTKQRAQAYKDEAEEQAKAAQAEADAYEKKAQAEWQKRMDAQKAEKAAYLEQLEFEKKVIQLRIEAEAEGTDEMLRLRLAAINKEREIELEKNRQAVAERRVDEALINAKYDKMRQAEISKNAKEATDIIEEEVKQAKSRKSYGNLWDVLIPDSDDPAVQDKIEGIREAVSQFVAQIMEVASQLIGVWEEQAEKAVESANTQVEAAQKVVDAEREAAANGYANNVRRAEQELALAKKNQEKALREEEKAQKARLALESVTQAASLVTASANIWSSMSGIPIVGPALAITSIALMWGSFLASKIKASQATKEAYGEGTVELLQGGSHASGNDISLGRKADGTERRAEGGEFFAVINRKNSRRYRTVIPDVIQSFNDGTFADKYQRANATIAGSTIITGGADLSRLESGVDAIRRQGENQRTVEGGKVVIRYKNLTRKVRYEN